MTRRTIVCIVLSLITVACERVNIDCQDVYEKTYSGYNSNTKVVFQKPEILWSRGDAVHSFANNSRILKSVIVEEDNVFSIAVPTEITNNDTYVYSLHTQFPVELNDNCGVSIRVDNSIQRGTFDEGYISVANSHVDGSSLVFNCITSFLEFEITDERIAYLIFHSMEDVALSGQGIRIITSGNELSVDGMTFMSNPCNSIRVNINGPGVYYIWTLPVRLENGFTIDCYDSNGQLFGVMSSFNPLQLQQRTIIKLGVLEEYLNNSGLIDDVFKVKW